MLGGAWGGPPAPPCASRGSEARPLCLGGVTDPSLGLVDVLVDPGAVSGVLVDAVGLSINFEDAIGVFWTQGASGALPWAW